MYEIKLFAESERELETLIQTVRICSQDIGVELCIENELFKKWKVGNDTWQKESN